MVDLEVKELFKDEAVTKNVSCKESCSACCHTQVSITSDEANLLVDEIVNGKKIDLRRLRLLA